ncbi:bifunctional folylpolyglutamate synthase/dihydrofolate synthase [Candidatus Ruminimicrobium bovinum]|uniref:bifunctional folylpolyglutamate synthase/dihydrofolate synthase n=1 Tax=Candidatus Ruminimicrobium bovinum TaxID=3242779 RepID=UPI0039B866B4
MLYSADGEYKNMVLGTERIEKFLFDLNINFRKLKYIHIAGTNGKGSTAKMLAEILTASKYKTGLYTSPHIIDITERIQINSVPVKKEDLNKLDNKYKKLSEKYGLTFFEYITALAFIYFVKKNVDIVVLETGLGGRFDATNIIKPLVSIITTVSFDHTEILGKTLKKIAFEKAGIIKNKIPVVCGKMPNTAFNVIKETAQQKHTSVYRLGFDFTATGNKNYNWQDLYQTVYYRSNKLNISVNLGLLGKSQIYNTAVVLYACELLKNKGFKINFSKIPKILEKLKYIARFDIQNIKIKNKNLRLIIDGAHNKQAVSNFLSLYKKSPFYKKENPLLFAVMEEKNYTEIIKNFSSAFTSVFIVDINNKRELKPNLIKKEFLKYTSAVTVIKNLNSFFNKLQDNETIVVSGSFYLAGYIIKYLKERKCLTII